MHGHRSHARHRRPFHRPVEAPSPGACAPWTDTQEDCPVATATRMKPSLASIIRRVLASVPGEQMTLAEVVEGARYHGYDYGPLCDGDDGRILGLTEKALARLVNDGQAAESLVGGMRVWRKCVSVPTSATPVAAAAPRAATATPTSLRPPAPRRYEEPEADADTGQAPWWPLTPANAFGLAFLVLVLVAVGLAWWGLLSWTER